MRIYNRYIAILSIFLLITGSSSWKVEENNDDKKDERIATTTTATAEKSAAENKTTTQSDEEIMGRHIYRNEEIYSDGSDADDDTAVDAVIDTILHSSRTGRLLDGYTEIQNDQELQQSLQIGDDNKARSLVKQKLCVLGLMNCNQNRMGHPYGQPRPMPFNGKYGPPRKVGYEPPSNSFGKPPFYGNGPSQYMTAPPLSPIPPRNDVIYSKPPPGALIYETKPPGPVYNAGASGSGGIITGADNPYQFENHKVTSKIYVSDSASYNPGPVYKPGSVYNPSSLYKPSLSENSIKSIVVAGGSIGTPNAEDKSQLQQHVHHHYHHIEGEGNKVATSIPVSELPSSITNIQTENSITQFQGSDSLYAGNSNGYYGSKAQSPVFNSAFGNSEGFADSSAFKAGFNGASNFKVGFNGAQQGIDYQNGLGSNTNNLYTSFKQKESNSGGLGGFGSYASGQQDLYSKRQFVSDYPNKQNSLTQFGNSQFGDSKYSSYNKDSISNRQFGDCVCVPYQQCPGAERIGKKDDLILPLDPRNLNSNIEALEDEMKNGTLSSNSTETGASRSKRDTNTFGNLPIENVQSKPVVEAEEKSIDVDEDAEGRARRQQGQQCRFNEVCCRQPNGLGGSKLGECGVRNAHGITGRIKTPVFVDGDSEFGEYPWQVAILKKDPKESVYICGGTLIDDRFILTAAHCVKPYQGYDLKIRLGEWDVNHDVEFFPYLERDAASVTIHPDYYAGTLDNDLAIIKLTIPVDFTNNPHISPICLPDKYSDFTGARCWTTGWGKDAFGDNGKYQNILKEVDVPIIEQNQCQYQLQNTRLGHSYRLHPGFLCAGGEEGKDACKGDGGGSLVCERAGSWQMVGVVSWGIGCGQRNVPGVYVRVSYYLDWINQIRGRF